MLRQSKRTIAVKFEMRRAVELRLTDKAVPVRVVKIDGTLKLLPKENTTTTGANKCDSERCAKHLSVDPFLGNEAVVIGNENLKALEIIRTFKYMMSGHLIMGHRPVHPAPRD